MGAFRADRLLCTVVVGLAAAAPLAGQAVVSVPGDHATIQAALDVASAGTVILVAPGTYAEALVFPGVDLVLEGVGGADSVTIDATGLGTSTVTIQSGESAACVLRGLTITGGSGQPIGASAFGGGGVMIASGASPTLVSCVITGNSATHESLASFGGGVLVAAVAGEPSAGASLTDCTLSFNEASTAGGGAYFAGAVSVRDCLFEWNQAGEEGGGLATSPQFGAATIQRSTFTKNLSIDGGGVSGSPGAQFFECRFISNGVSERGGGYFESTAGGASIEDCFFDENTAARGAAVFLAAEAGATSRAQGCVFANNFATSGGDSVYVSTPGGGGVGEISHCTLSGDDVASAGADLSVDHCIIRNVEPIFLVTGSVEVTWSNVEGGWSGTGNIDADPLFADPGSADYSLSPGSPCINTGDPGDPLDPDGSPADMGARTYHPWTDLGNGLPSPVVTPRLDGSGPLIAGSDLAVTLTQGLPGSTPWLVVGFRLLDAPFYEGVMVPQADLILSGALLGGSGSLQFRATWPANVPSGTSVWFQSWITPGGGHEDWAASNGLRATVP